MKEKWILARGQLADGFDALVLADTAYGSPQARGERKILLAINFPGTYMMQSQERRDAFLEALEQFLSEHSGVHVAGVTRLGVSYTFLFYLGKAAGKSDIPLPAEVAEMARVLMAHDPKWREYTSYVPARRGLFENIRSWWKSAFARPSATPIHSGETDGLDDDERVLRALSAAGSDLSLETDIVFYLYLPTKDDADRCCFALWDQGYRAQVNQPLGELPNGTVESRWGVISHLEAVPSKATLAKARELMTALAQDSGGEYDGWEAAVA